MNTSKKDIRKIFSALVFPMHPDESLNYEVLSDLIEYELSIGVEGFYVSGSSGEALLLSNEERKQSLEKVMKIVNGRVPVISHVGTIRTEDVIDLAKHAASVGVDAVSMIPPYYYKFSMDEICEYYEAVCRAVPGMGVIVYNIPQFTGIEFNKDNADRLLSNKGVIGIKHTSTNLYSLERMKSAYPDKIFFNGFDEQFIGARVMGADATIGTTVNVFAPLFLKANELLAGGDLVEAYRVQSEINYCVEEMCRVGIFSAVKYILSRRGIDLGNCRKPFHPLAAEEQARIDRLIDQYDQFRKAI